MDNRWTLQSLGDLRGAPVYDSAGEKIGKVDEIYYDMGTRQPEWIALGTGFFGTKRALVPVAGAQPREDGILVPYTKDQVKDSPDFDGDEIAPEYEPSLYRHYGLTDTGTGSRASAQPEGAAVTRKEEELQVGKRPVEAGRVRLRKWVETEPVDMDVELRQETARVSRERVDQPVGDHDFREEEVEVPLRGEEAMVQKQAVAKERVGVGKDVRTERETVSDEVRKERVEVEGDVDEGRR